MSTKTQRALDLFNNGYNCAQAVLSVFAEEQGLDLPTGLKLACGLGGGFRSGEICGAASGAALVIGLAEAPGNVTDRQAMGVCGRQVMEFMAAFQKMASGLTCEEILSMDATTKNAMDPAVFAATYRPICNNLVEQAVCILEGMGY